MKKATILFSLLLIVNSIIAQNINIKGQITCKNAPIEFANVILQTQDSTFVSGGTTDMNGYFSIKNVKGGIYNLKISSIGYKTHFIAIDNSDKNYNLGKINLDENSVALKGVTVTASSVINETNKNIYFPSAFLLKTSKNGLDLLKNLNLNRIEINPLNREISSLDDGNVLLKINGAPASINEIEGLLPKDIIRVEYHDQPSLRYGNDTAAVIDYIVRRPDTGGNIFIMAENSPIVGWGNDNITTKFNHKNSQFGLRYYIGYRDFKKYYRDYTETFNFNDKPALIREEEGIPNTYVGNWQTLELNYSYMKKDDWFFNASLETYTARNNPKTESYLYARGDEDNKSYMKDHDLSKNKRPSLDLYAEKKINQDETLIFNVVGTYFRTNNNRDYSVRKLDETDYTTEINSRIKGDKYSLISEVIYENKFGENKISTGLRHMQTFTKNRYSGNISATTRMNEAHSYAYIEYMRKINNFNFVIGGQLSRSYYSQKDKSYEKYSVLPRLQMSYKINKNLFIKYNGRMYRHTPNLSDLNDVRQKIDSLQIRQGNPDLKTSTAYKNVLNMNYRKGLFSANLFLLYLYEKNPNMESIYQEDDHFVRIVENQKSWQKLNPEIELKVGPIKDILSLKFSTGMNYYKSVGQNYNHEKTNFYYRANVTANYKKFSAFFTIQNNYNKLYGETYRYGENFNVVGVSYRYKQLDFGIIGINLLGDDYVNGSKNISAIAPSRNFMQFKGAQNLFAFNITWNFSFGKKYKEKSKRINNVDNNAGTLKYN